MEQQEKYENLIERNIVASTSLQTAVGSLVDNTKVMNDNFVLHQKTIEEIVKEMHLLSSEQTLMRNDLLKWIKYLVASLIVVLGGKEVISLFSDKI